MCISHLGPVYDQKYSRTFKQKGREESCEMDDPEPGQKICQLYLIENWQLFYGNFIRPKIKVGTEWVYKGQNADNCLNSVAALARTMYNRLFLWLVDLCNRTWLFTELCHLGPFLGPFSKERLRKKHLMNVFLLFMV